MTKAEKMVAKKTVEELGTITAAAKKLGVSRSSVRRALAALDRKGGKKAPSAVPASKSEKGHNLKEFRAQYDKDYIVPKKIKDGLKEIGASWEYESVFVKSIGVSPADMATYRETFADYIVFIRRDNKRVVAGTTALAKQLRAML